MSLLLLHGLTEYSLWLRALQGFVDLIFKLMGLPLRSPDYSLSACSTTHKIIRADLPLS